MATTIEGFQVLVQRATEAADRIMSAINMADLDTGADAEAEALRAALVELRPLMGPISAALVDLGGKLPPKYGGRSD